MEDESVGCLMSQSQTTQSQSLIEDSIYEDCSIQLPDLEETQIIDNEDDQVRLFSLMLNADCLFAWVDFVNDIIYQHNKRHHLLLPFQREVSLFLQTKAGKVCGPETTPFVLPKRWTLKTLKNCVEDYINRKSDGGERRVKHLFYRRARGKSIVRLDSESDISALLDEYPLRHPTGKKKSGRCIMYLAADLEDVNGKRLNCLTTQFSIEARPQNFMSKVIDKSHPYSPIVKNIGIWGTKESY